MFGAILLALIACFHQPLGEATALALANDLYSHILLVPLISAYLAWNRRGGAAQGGAVESPSLVFLGFALAAAGSALVLRHGTACAEGALVDRLALDLFALVTLVVAAARVALGRVVAERHAFPLLFLYFCVPMPQVLEFQVSSFFQYWSALASDWLIRLTGTPVLRQGMMLYLPGVTLEVANECSGIRSSLVLLMTALLAGHLFLDSVWGKWIIALVVVPIGVMRNAVRITALAWMAVHVDEAVLAGPLHREGGVPFFVLSLIPLLLVLVIIRMAEKRKRRTQPEGKVTG